MMVVQKIVDVEEKYRSKAWNLQKLRFFEFASSTIRKIATEKMKSEIVMKKISLKANFLKFLKKRKLKIMREDPNSEKPLLINRIRWLAFIKV